MDHETATVHTLFFNQTYPAPSQELHVTAGLVMFALGLCALVVDAGVAFVMLHYRVLTNNGFAVLYMNMVLCECFNLLGCILFVAPVVALNLKWLGDSLFGHKLAHFAVTLWTECTYMMIAVAVNRYVAIAVPHKYKTIFTMKNSLLIVAFTWVAAILTNLGLFMPTCVLAAVPEWLGIVFSDNACGRALFAHCAVTCTISIGVLIVFNVLTWQAMRRTNKTYYGTFAPKPEKHVALNTPTTGKTNTQRTTTFHASIQVPNKEVLRRRQVEITYFKQAGMVVSYHIFTQIFQSPLGFYIFGMLPFMLVHGTNGFIMLYMHTTLRKKILAILQREPMD